MENRYFLNLERSVCIYAALWTETHTALELGQAQNGFPLGICSQRWDKHVADSFLKTFTEDVRDSRPLFAFREKSNISEAVDYCRVLNYSKSLN